MYSLPHKRIEELRAELQEARAESKKNMEWEREGGVRYSRMQSCEKELELKTQYIQELEGDLKQMKAISAQESMQYLRHTLVKFLCDATKSEQEKIVNVVEQLLEMTWGSRGNVMHRPEESAKLEKNFKLHQRGWFF